MAKNHSDPKTAASARLVKRGLPGDPPPRTGPRPQDRSKKTVPTPTRHYGPKA